MEASAAPALPAADARAGACNQRRLVAARASVSGTACNVQHDACMLSCHLEGYAAPLPCAQVLTDATAARTYYDSAKLQFGNYYLLCCWCFDPKILWFSRNSALSNYMACHSMRPRLFLRRADEGDPPSAVVQGFSFSPFMAVLFRPGRLDSRNTRRRLRASRGRIAARQRRKDTVATPQSSCS